MKNLFNSSTLWVSMIFIMTALTSCRTTPYQKIGDGLIVNISNPGDKANYSVRLQVVTDNIIHVTAIPGDKFADDKSLIVLDTITPRAKFTVSAKGDTIILKTTSVHAINR
jgi:alpha-D-xyloside xylohydrolase